MVSSRLNAEMLTSHLPWKVLETQTVARDGADQYLTTFDLGIGKHERVEQHLEALKDAILAQQRELGYLLGDCEYTLIVYYEFPMEGAINLSSSIQAAFAFLRIQVQFYVRTTPNA